MASHEFGIMCNDPIVGIRYDKYEPDKYNCIKIYDDYIEQNLVQFEKVDTYWHTLDHPAKGLAYYGITIIPPVSLDSFITVLELQSISALEPLIYLSKEALYLRKHLIHFGI